MKSRIAPILAFATLALAAAPTDAFAKEVAVAPFIAKAGLDPLIALNITSLVSSELDFASEYDGAVQIEEKPKGLTVACLSQSACLKKIGTATGTEHLVAGSVAPAGDQYEIYMVLYDTSGGTYVRKKSFKVETTPERMADSMGGFVKELVTGKSVGAAQAEATVEDDFGSFEDDDFDDFDFEEESVNTRIELPQTSTADLDDFEEEPDEWEMEQRAQEEEARRRAEDEARRRAEEQERERQEAEARRRAEEQENQRREEEARRRAEQERADREAAERQRAEDERRRREEDDRARREAELAAAEVPEEEDWDDISFGDATDEIEVEIDDISFGDATSDIVSDYGSPDSYDDDDYGYREYDSLDSSSDDDYSRSSRTSSRSYEDLDVDEGRSSSSSSRSSSRDTSSSPRSGSSRSGSSSRSSSSGTITTNQNDPKVGLSLRAGYSNFQGVFNFVTYGGELTIPVADAVFVNVGLEGYSTQRAIPVALRDDYGGASTRWNHIMPFNLGLTYKNTKRDFRPYIGGDITLTPYTKNFKTAPGVRVHTGADLMITDQFGLNANLGVGAWYGKDFDTVQVGVSEGGVTAAVSAGTVILF